MDDTDLRTVSGRAWRAKLAVVTQDALLFHGSIADNIVLGDDTPDWDRMRVRRKRRTCWSLRKRCPKGWTPKWGTAEASSAAASVSVWRWRGRCTETPMCCCWTRPRPPWTQVQSLWFSKRWNKP